MLDIWVKRSVLITSIVFGSLFRNFSLVYTCTFVNFFPTQRIIVYHDEDTEWNIKWMFTNSVSQTSSLTLIFNVFGVLKNMGANNSNFSELSSNDYLKKLSLYNYQSLWTKSITTGAKLYIKKARSMLTGLF